MSAGMGSMVSFGKVILPEVLGSFGVAYLFFNLERNCHAFRDKPAPTYTDKAWMKGSLSKFDSRWEREAKTPMVLNPILRQNFQDT